MVLSCSDNFFLIFDLYMASHMCIYMVITGTMDIHQTIKNKYIFTCSFHSAAYTLISRIPLSNTYIWVILTQYFMSRSFNPTYSSSQLPPSPSCHIRRSLGTMLTPTVYCYSKVV